MPSFINAKKKHCCLVTSVRKQRRVAPSTDLLAFLWCVSAVHLSCSCSSRAAHSERRSERVAGVSSSWPSPPERSISATDGPTGRRTGQLRPRRVSARQVRARQLRPRQVRARRELDRKSEVNGDWPSQDETPSTNRVRWSRVSSAETSNSRLSQSGPSLSPGQGVCSGLQ